VAFFCSNGISAAACLSYWKPLSVVSHTLALLVFGPILAFYGLNRRYFENKSILIIWMTDGRNPLASFYLWRK
jgi:hypothetical protein